MEWTKYHFGSDMPATGLARAEGLSSAGEELRPQCLTAMTSTPTTTYVELDIAAL